MPKKNYNPEDVDRAVALAKSIGITAAARECGMEVSALGWHTRARGVKCPRSKRKDFCPSGGPGVIANREAIDRAVEVGVPKAAKEFGLSNSYLYRLCYRAEVSPLDLRDRVGKFTRIDPVKWYAETFEIFRHLYAGQNMTAIHSLTGASISRIRTIKEAATEAGFCLPK